MSDSIQDSTRYVVSKLHQGSIIPGTRREIDRDVFLQPGADVRGGVWGASLSVEGPNVRVADAVYCRGAVSISSAETNAPNAEEADSAETDRFGEGRGPVTFGSCVTTPDSLVVRDTFFKTRFLADVYLNRLNLSRAIIFGNVYARRAVIRDSIVLGCIFCENQLTLENSFINTFQAGRAHVGAHVSMFAPLAVARDELQMEGSVRAVAFADVFEAEDAFEIDEHVELDEEDVFEVDLALGGDSTTDGAGRKHVLSLSERILDSDLVYDRLRENKRLLRQLALQRHLDDAEPDTLRALERTLWRRTRHQAPPQVERTTGSLSDLMARFGGQEARPLHKGCGKPPDYAGRSDAYA
jgi:hypothetical protein